MKESKKPFSQSLNPEQKKLYNYSLVQSVDGLFYLFLNSAATVAIIKPANVWNGWKEFSEKVATESELVNLYILAKGEEPTKEQKEDLVELSVLVWIRLCETALNRLATPKSDGRKVSEKMLNRAYEVLKTEVAPDVKMPPQAKTCLVFFTECMAGDAEYQKKEAPRPTYIIAENLFKDYVIANAARLNTRQDPWRIFQYYRPELIKSGFLRLI